MVAVSKIRGMYDEAKIEQINKYRVTIDGKIYEDFKKVAEWEGMIKF